MRRQENQPPRPTAGCLSVPLFNQKKRNRIPLTSTPSENEFFSHSEYMASTSSATSQSTPGEVFSLYAFTVFLDLRQILSVEWIVIFNVCLCFTNLPLMFHTVVSDQCSHLFGCFYCVQREAFPAKPAVKNSLRILTAVIDGMRHWSQFKDKVHCLFEIFATLDSAVTVGRYGAKNFLMRDGKEVVQCVFYETQVLPRLIRGQVHRCVGNYDRSRDVLMCFSVRPGLPTELRNAQEAVKACDAEMRALVKSLSEV
uniref:Spermatogenesis associated 22 n=1 Tax=Stegastes partitus TaxID=144197 RepID=A0A3B5BDZ0_9TELE